MDRATTKAVQISECTFPIQLTDLLHPNGHLAGGEILRYLPMVRRMDDIVVRNGPIAGQDRREEDAGYSPFTLAVEISGLLAAADRLDLTGDQARQPGLLLPRRAPGDGRCRLAARRVSCRSRSVRRATPLSLRPC